LKKWDVVTSLEGHDNEVKAVAWSFDGKLLASCGRDKKVWIWEQIDGHEFECVAMLDGHSQDVKCVKWHPKRNILVSTSYDDTLRVWIEDGGDWYCHDTLSGHASTVWSCSFDLSGDKLVSCSDDKGIILWKNEYDKKVGSWNKCQTIKNNQKYTIYR
jgi:WD40 repeat protein